MTVIDLCRFDATGSLCLEPKDLDNTTYVAVSHVWGEASEHDIPGVAWKVLASPHKALFIATQLRKLVEGHHFWMDVLAVDQSTREARASVVRHIPEIYRKALFTLIVREQGGLDGCCYTAFQWPEVFHPTALTQTWTLLDNHIRQEHPRGFREAWMERNWPLQELMLSNRVQFTVCSALPQTDEVLPSMPTSVATVKGWIFMRDLWTMGQSWTGSSSLGDDVESFIIALFFNTAVERAPLDDGSRPSVSNLLLSLSDSIRQTGRPQDFVLAIFPQFSWYSLPPNPGSKSFGELLRDMLFQLEQSAQGNSIHSAPPEDARIRSKITEGMLHGFSIDAAASYAPSQDVPIPTSVGDFCKLLHKPQSRELLPGTSQIFPWTLECLDLAADTTDFVSILVSTFESLDLTVLQGFTSQLAALSNDPARLMAIFGEHHLASTANLGSSQRDQISTLSREYSQNPIVAMDAMAILSNVLRFVFMKIVPSTMGALAQRVHEQNPDASGMSALNLQPRGSMEEEWRQVVNNFKEFDNTTFRETIALVAATISCDLGLSALPWLRQMLTVYVLKQDHWIASSKRRTLCFAARNLDLTRLRKDYTIHAHASYEPYVVAKNRIAAEKQVIGLAPIRGSTLIRLAYKGIDKIMNRTNALHRLASE